MLNKNTVYIAFTMNGELCISQASHSAMFANEPTALLSLEALIFNSRGHVEVSSPPQRFRVCLCACHSTVPLMLDFHWILPSFFGNDVSRMGMHTHTFHIWNKTILRKKKKNLNFSLCLHRGGVLETQMGGVGSLITVATFALRSSGE